MSSGELVPASEAAQRLGVSQSRIRALISAGALGGEKMGGRWFVGLDGIRRRERWGAVDGRQLHPANAWGALALGSGARPTWISDDDVRRLARMLDDRGLLGLAPRMRQRATAHRFYGHPGILQALATTPEVRLTGISVARENAIGIVGGREVDAYIAANALESIVTRFALEPRAAPGNVSLRTLSPEVAHLADAPTPRAAAVLDIAEASDSRSMETGTAALQRLDDEKRWRRVVPEPDRGSPDEGACR
jgi:excisionase family DNA binding protein